MNNKFYIRMLRKFISQPRPGSEILFPIMMSTMISGIWEVSPKHPRDPFLDIFLFYYIVFVFLSATFSSKFAHLIVHDPDLTLQSGSAQSHNSPDTVLLLLLMQIQLVRYKAWNRGGFSWKLFQSEPCSYTGPVMDFVKTNMINLLSRDQPL